MTAVAYIAAYTGALIFLIGCAGRIWMYARTPLHLRWELYPLPHEHPYRAAYGGSYFETQEWWKRPQVTNRRGEWRVLLEEVVLQKSLRESNRKLWLPSLLFHSGLYFAIAACGAAVAEGVASSLPAWKGGAGFTSALTQIASGVGLASAVLIVAGACLLLLRRAGDAGMRNSTKSADLFNLALFIVSFGLLAGGCLLRGPGAASLGEFARGILHFDASVRVGNVFGIGVVLASALVAYIPYTHMAHFIAKYFTWHAVRWDDQRHKAGDRIEAAMAENLDYKPTWSAAHIGADGRRTWAEIAADPPAETKR